jgi:hypothetical protein
VILFCTGHAFHLLRAGYADVIAYGEDERGAPGFRSIADLLDAFSASGGRIVGGTSTNADEPLRSGVDRQPVTVLGEYIADGYVPVTI